MMDHFLTSTTFQRGLNKYLNALQVFNSWEISIFDFDEIYNLVLGNSKGLLKMTCGCTSQSRFKDGLKVSNKFWILFYIYNYPLLHIYACKLYHTSNLLFQAHEDGILPESLNVKEIMDTWTLQTGFPVVTVDRNYESKSATISQVMVQNDHVHG